MKKIRLKKKRKLRRIIVYEKKKKKKYFENEKINIQGKCKKRMKQKK